MHFFQASPLEERSLEGKSNDLSRKANSTDDFLFSSDFMVVSILKEWKTENVIKRFRGSNFYFILSMVNTIVRARDVARAELRYGSAVPPK
jgi:hypothetical protein